VSLNWATRRPEFCPFTLASSASGRPGSPLFCWLQTGCRVGLRVNDRPRRRASLCLSESLSVCAEVIEQRKELFEGAQCGLWSAGPPRRAKLGKSVSLEHQISGHSQQSQWANKRPIHVCIALMGYIRHVVRSVGRLHLTGTERACLK